MVNAEELLVETLERLGLKALEDFQWYLHQPWTYPGKKPIPRISVEKVSVLETSSAIAQHYGHQAVEVAMVVFEKIGRYDLVQELIERSSEQKEEKIHEPLEEKIKIYQHKFQSYMKSNFMCVQEGMAKKTAEQRLDHIFIKLFITDGGDTQINEQHEVVQSATQNRRAALDEKPIEPSDLFRSSIGRSIRTVLTTGVAGIGKTFLVKKFVLDWAERRENQDLHLIFPLSFSELNPHKGKSLCLAELVHLCIPKTRAIMEDDLNDIFSELQTQLSQDCNESKYKLLFVLDGLDESRLQLALADGKQTSGDFDVARPTSVEVLLSALISGKLLESARVWITTRPAAAGLIHQEFVQRITLVRGFNDPQKEDYFKIKFRHNPQASTLISHIKASESLFIMCHIPVFCWITSVVVEDVLKSRTTTDLPTTLTQMYTEFLIYQIKQTKDRCGKKKSVQYIQALAKLAFHKLNEDENVNVFYEKDLRDYGIHSLKALKDLGMLTEIFKEVHRWKEDHNNAKSFSFVHLSLQEYLAALHVVMKLINDNRNVLNEQNWISKFPVLNLLFTLCRRTSMTEVLEMAIQRASQSPNGHQDLFLRFLLGLSLQVNQDLLEPLLKDTESPPQTDHQLTIQSIHRRIRENATPERNVNLFYCLYELKDNSLVEDIQHYLKSQSRSMDRISPAHWAALVFILLTSPDAMDEFNLREYFPSEEGLLRLMPVVKASHRSLLTSCNLSDKVCVKLASLLSSPSSKLRELDLSDNDLQDSGVKRLCAGLESPNCALQSLKLSGCMISQKGAASLVSALRSNPSSLKELDLSYNHPGYVYMLRLFQENPKWSLDTLNLDNCGKQRLLPGLKKYICELALDPNTAHRNLKVSDEHTKVTAVREKQSYSDHPERFDCWLQVLCAGKLTGRCYWEVAWSGEVSIAVTYKAIIRKGEGSDISLGANAHSWALHCGRDGSHRVRHQSQETSVGPRASLESHRAAVFLDFPAGTLTFFKVESDELVPLHTFRCKFTEPLYAAFGFGFRHSFENFESSVSLREVEDNIFFC